MFNVNLIEWLLHVVLYRSCHQLRRTGGGERPDEQEAGSLRGHALS